MKTSFPKPAQPNWHIVDAAGQTLGRLSVKIATVLRGRHRASFVPHLKCGDHVVVINASKVKLTGNKVDQKAYFKHTGFFGGLKETSVKRMMDKEPGKMLTLAVKGMLPKNATRKHVLKQLHVFSGAEHKHEAQNPTPFPL